MSRDETTFLDIARLALIYRAAATKELIAGIENTWSQDPPINHMNTG